MVSREILVLNLGKSNKYKECEVAEAFAPNYNEEQVFQKVRDGERIAIHQRHFNDRRYVTDSEHMPENHKAVAAFRSFDGKYYRNKAYAIGNATGTFVKTLLEKADFKKQAFVTYTTLKNILKNGQDTQSETTNTDAETLTPYPMRISVSENGSEKEKH